jgi:hypothetical protein
MEEDEEGKEGQEAESDGAGDISEDEEPTINREELVNTYCGPPCSVQSLLAIIKRKNRQGRYAAWVCKTASKAEPRKTQDWILKCVQGG